MRVESGPRNLRRKHGVVDGRLQKLISAIGNDTSGKTAYRGVPPLVCWWSIGRRGRDIEPGLEASAWSGKRGVTSHCMGGRTYESPGH